MALCTAEADVLQRGTGFTWQLCQYPSNRVTSPILVPASSARVKNYLCFEFNMYFNVKYNTSLDKKRFQSFSPSWQEVAALATSQPNVQKVTRASFLLVWQHGKAIAKEDFKGNKWAACWLSDLLVRLLLKSGNSRFSSTNVLKSKRRFLLCYQNMI